MKNTNDEPSPKKAALKIPPEIETKKKIARRIKPEQWQAMLDAMKGHTHSPRWEKLISLFMLRKDMAEPCLAVEAIKEGMGDYCKHQKVPELISDVNKRFTNQSIGMRIYIEGKIRGGHWHSGRPIHTKFVLCRMELPPSKTKGYKKQQTAEQKKKRTENPLPRLPRLP